jgi:hypothetical protein
MVDLCQLNLQQSGRVSLRLLLRCDVSFAYCHSIYMDGLQDYFPSHCKPPYHFAFLLHPMTPCFVDYLCLCHGTCTIILQFTPVLDMDLVSSSVVQCIQPGAQLRRGQSQSSLAPSPSRSNNRVPSHCPTLGHRRVMFILVINIRPRARFDDDGPRGHDVHI